MSRDRGLATPTRAEFIRTAEGLATGPSSIVDATASSGLPVSEGAAVSCALGDVDGDGLLDIAIANLSTLDHALSLLAEPFLYNLHNELLLNRSNLEFEDVSATSGVQALAGVPAGEATLTWALMVLDIDLDGDQDIVYADDQAAIPTEAQGGLDRGYFQVLHNDGSGQFTASAVGDTGLWMGLAAGDFNCDGHFDLFGSNFGDYAFALLDPGYQLGHFTSRWLLGSGNGASSEVGVGDVVATPFGWGASSLDYDNDGDLDLLFHGGMDLVAVVERPTPALSCATTAARQASRSTRTHSRRPPIAAVSCKEPRSVTSTTMASWTS